MIFRQLFDSNTYTYTYLIGCEQTREAAIIDPVLDNLNTYLQLLDQLQLTLTYALDTHTHADHITALGALRDQTGCITLMGEQSQAACISRTIKNNDFIMIGQYKITALYTPGHTDESYSYLMNDRIFTGDTLLIRGTGRTDFQAGDAAASYQSITEILFKLPDGLMVYPGHDYKGWTVSTIGEEKQYNPRLSGKSREDYIDIMNTLNLPDPKMMDIAVPSNLRCGQLL